ncbi:MAG: enoyl-CoA hydratase-related protein, partial [Cohaesibacter sp.]|nr:enoyl-CoA hydratase-related protein [Cohaesibacter sp.]
VHHFCLEKMVCFSQSLTFGTMTKTSRHVLNKPCGFSTPLTLGAQSYSAKDEGKADGESQGHHPKEPVILVDKMTDFSVMTIGLNRPEKRNCVNGETSQALHEAFEDFENDEAMHCCILHGLGGNFCAGFDLEELSSYEDDDLPNKLAAILDRGPMVAMSYTIHPISNLEI